MKTLLLLLAVIFGLSNAVEAQTISAEHPQTQPFGIIDTADLKMSSCDFEKDANALVLFDVADVNTGFTSTTVLRHKRIKILNDKGKDEADFSLEYYSRHGIEDISNVEAETINMDKNVIEFIPVEKKLIYHEVVDKSRKKIVFSFPNVKAGSVIEFTYKLTISNEGSFPDWTFQESIPVRYSEFNASIRNDYSYKMIPRIYQDYKKNTKEPWMKGDDTIGNKYTWALSNVASYKDEAYSTCKDDNIESIEFFLSAIKFTLYGKLKSLEKSWPEIGSELVGDPDYGTQLKETSNDEDLIAKAKLLSSDNEKINYIFSEIKNKIKWDGRDRWYTNDGTKKAWDKKSGNSTEINIILYQFLRQAGIKCYPLLVSTRDNGKVNASYPSIHQFNKTVVYVARDDKSYYILDASDKFGIFSNVPFDVLNSNGLIIDPFHQIQYSLIYLKNETPSRKVVFVTAEIKPDGRLEGTAQINSFNYTRTNGLKMYDKLGENKYITDLKNGDNNLQITSFKRENVENDTLPLTEHFNFKLDLTGSDDVYIYFSANLFTSFQTNPFFSESRNSTIDFGSLNNYNISGRYKIPPGYKIEALPKSQSLVMPDKSIGFKRIIADQDGEIIVHYTIDYKRSIFSVDEYPSIRDFYKKMYEMLNEQIVLKKL